MAAERREGEGGREGAEGKVEGTVKRVPSHFPVSHWTATMCDLLKVKRIAQTLEKESSNSESKAWDTVIQRPIAKTLYFSWSVD